MWIRFHESIYSRFDKRSARISLHREWKLVLFFQSTLCLVGCLVIIHNKTEHTYISCYQQQFCFAVMAASLFLDFCSVVPNVTSMSLDLRGKKAFSFSHSNLHPLLFGYFAFLIERIVLNLVRDAKLLE